MRADSGYVCVMSFFFSSAAGSAWGSPGAAGVCSVFELSSSTCLSTCSPAVVAVSLFVRASVFSETSPFSAEGWFFVVDLVSVLRHKDQTGRDQSKLLRIHIVIG